MTTITVDTHELVKQLISSYNFSEEQAEGVVHAVNSIDLSSLATKADLEGVRKEIDGAKSELGAEIREMELRLKLWMGKSLIAAVGVFSSRWIFTGEHVDGLYFLASSPISG